ncbi:MAG: prolyl oligopeptidase family serine peptidase [Thermomicrobiales bacterium]
MTAAEWIETRRQEIVETLYGVTIRDPYRWLEESDSPETRVWTEMQNSHTERLLGAVAGREALGARLAELLQVGTVTSPSIRGGRLFYLKREGEQNQPALYVRDHLDSPERLLFDPNAVDEAGLVALDWWYPSPDGRLVAFGVSRDGDEWSTLQVLDAETGSLFVDEIERARYSSVGWLPDGNGFFYTRYPQPGTVPPGEESYNSHVFFHRLGNDAADDPKVFGEGRSPQDMIDVTISADGRWLVAIAFQGWAKSEVYLRDLTAPEPRFVPVVEGVDAIFDNPIVSRDRLYLRTNLDAPNYRVIEIDATDPDPESWRTILAESPDRVVESFALAGTVVGARRIVTGELHAAISLLRVYSATGEHLRDVDLPALGTVQGLDAEETRPTVVVGFASFAIAPRVYVFDVESGERRPLSPLPPPSGFDPASIEVRQVSYRSKDGTSISMFLVHRRGLEQTGNHPTYLTGYGGFNISLTPSFRAPILAWLERGGVFAMPNLRGGGEYGEAWHRAGMLGNKQNVFDDFIGAAEWLIDQGYTDPNKLAIVGGSNGGLLVGAALTQRPELFRAVVCAVPLLDMLRYHHFSIAKLWIPEYGSAEDAEAFRWLYAYSPYHRVVDGTCYPATLLTTAEQDSRVDPMHARKMTALLEAATSRGDERPILLRAETWAGHGVGKPLSKRIAEAADQLAFVSWQLGMPLVDETDIAMETDS